MLVTNAVDKPKIDDRNYRVIKLENELEVLLVQDVKADKASAALDVNVGSYSDPSQLPGLAHFLEHLLFMGTKKFPSENEYSQFLTDHAGSYNAYTSSENTNYYLDVAWPYLHAALERFSQFFISPLFNESCKDREILAVDSENKKNLNSDMWRLNQLEKSNSNPKHPYSKFSTGNFQTLNKQGVRDDLIKFYHDHYSANLMKLTILGREDLDTLEKWATEMFTDVPNTKKHLEVYKEPPVAEMQTLIQAKPVMDIKHLEMRFLVGDEREKYRTNPGHYYSHLIGHESKGSLLYYFKEKGWANGLSCGVFHVSTGYDFFVVEIELTDSGIDHWESIVQCVFQYIDLLKSSGPQKWVFDELHSSTLASFSYMQKLKPSTTASTYSKVLQRPGLPREHLLRSNVMDEWDESLIKSFGESFTTDNVRMTLISQGLQNLDKKEQWYGTNYRIEKKSDFLNHLDTKNTLFHLPMHNDFIPRTFEVLDTIKAVQRPKLVINKPGYRVWYKKDDTFFMPKAQVEAKLTSEYCDSTVLSHMATELFVQIVTDALNDYAYYAEVAGLSYSVSTSQNGIEVCVHGFNEKLGNLLSVIIETIKSHKTPESRFKVLKKRLEQNLGNSRYSMPYQQLSSQSTLCWLSENMWDVESRLEALKSVDTAEVDKVQKAFSQSVNIEVLVVGNYTVSDAGDIGGRLKDGLKPQELVEKKVRSCFWLPRPSEYALVRELPDEDNINNAIEYRLQICGCTELRKRTALQILGQIFKEPTFDQLRTKEQLGYIVACYARPIRYTLWLRFIIQSEECTEYLESRIESLFPQLEKLLENMSDAEYKKHVDSVIATNLEKFKSLREEANSYWGNISTGYYDFSRRAETAAIARDLPKSEVIELFNEFVSKESDNRAKFVVHLKAKTQTKPRKDLSVQGEVVRSVPDFQHDLERVPVPKPVKEISFYKIDEPKL